MTYSQKKSENFQDFAPENENNIFRRGSGPDGKGKQNEKKVIYPRYYKVVQRRTGIKFVLKYPMLCYHVIFTGFKVRALSDPAMPVISSDEFLLILPVKKF